MTPRSAAQPAPCAAVLLRWEPAHHSSPCPPRSSGMLNRARRALPDRCVDRRQPRKSSVHPYGRREGAQVTEQGTRTPVARPHGDTHPPSGARNSQASPTCPGRKAAERQRGELLRFVAVLALRLLSPHHWAALDQLRVRHQQSRFNQRTQPIARLLAMTRMGLTSPPHHQHEHEGCGTSQGLTRRLHCCG